MNSHKYTEIFRSLQGEGCYTGKNSLWIRWFLCNLQCNGFGQDDPTDPSTYDLPYERIDVKDISRVEDLPVFDKGCDSSYSWAKKYRHLAHDNPASKIVSDLTDLMRTESNPDGNFVHPDTLQDTHMCFTGGEPMMRHNQQGTLAVMNEFAKQDNLPKNVTVETNGTQKLTDDMIEFVNTYNSMPGHEWFWSVSPKLFSTSGEMAKKAIKPENLAEYAKCAKNGQLKYVVNGTPESWKEVEEATKLFRAAGIKWDVYIMPVGATKESQELPEIAEICNEALARGYHVSSRVHAFIYGNTIGT